MIRVTDKSAWAWWLQPVNRIVLCVSMIMDFSVSGYFHQSPGKPLGSESACDRHRRALNLVLDFDFIERGARPARQVHGVYAALADGR